MALNPTDPRVELMRLVVMGVVVVERWNDGAVRVEIARTPQDRNVVNRLHDLINAGLVRKVPLFGFKKRLAQPTDAGRAWLAEYGKEN